MIFTFGQFAKRSISYPRNKIILFKKGNKKKAKKERKYAPIRL
jgi:hypothetical protein